MQNKTIDRGGIGPKLFFQKEFSTKIIVFFCLGEGTRHAEDSAPPEDEDLSLQQIRLQKRHIFIFWRSGMLKLSSSGGK